MKVLVGSLIIVVILVVVVVKLFRDRARREQRAWEALRTRVAKSGTKSSRRSKSD